MYTRGMRQLPLGVETVMKIPFSKTRRFVIAESWWGSPQQQSNTPLLI